MKKNISLFMIAGLVCLSSVLVSASTPICSTINECQSVIRDAKKAIADNTKDPRVCELTGKSLFPDVSVPKLGRAYRDQSSPQVIWGDIVKDEDGNNLQATELEASQYCIDISATLPSMDQYKDLYHQLSNGKDTCHVLIETDTEFLPGLSTHAVTTPESAQDRATYQGNIVAFRGITERHLFIAFAKSFFQAGEFVQQKGSFRCVVVKK